MIKKPGTDLPGKKKFVYQYTKSDFKAPSKGLNALYLSVQETIGYVDRENCSSIFHFITFFL